MQREGGPNIVEQVHQQRLQEIEQNRSIVKANSEVWLIMGKQNNAIRGREPEENNFLVTLSMHVSKNNSTRTCKTYDLVHEHWNPKWAPET